MAFLKQNYTRLPGDEKKEQEKNMREIETQKEISTLKQFIKELQEERLKETAIPKEKKDIKLGIQMLICNYLGLLDNLPKLDNGKNSMLLSQILNTTGNENIRKRLSSIDGLDSNKVRRKNLTYVIELFEKLGLNEIAKVVKSDLNKIPRSIDK